MKTVPLIFLVISFAGKIVLANSEENVENEDGWFVPQVDGNLKWISDQQWKILAQENYVRSSDAAVHFHLCTNDNCNNTELIATDNVDSLDNSKFESSIPTIIIIHGWGANYTSDVNILLRNALVQRGKYNIICVDWSSTAGNNLYHVSRRSVKDIGKQVAQFIDFLYEEAGISLSSLILVGHSLGAHVAGHAGKNSKNGRIGQIIALDPARPLFYHHDLEERLSSTDAVYVESIQTCGGRLGFLRPIGSATFYPNGGMRQPGCYDLYGSCSHSRSYVYYAQAILGNSFPAFRCEKYTDAIAKQCGDTYSTIKMGASTNYLNASGIFYVPIASGRQTTFN